jgi:hypothetical protein
MSDFTQIHPNLIRNGSWKRWMKKLDAGETRETIYLDLAVGTFFFFSVFFISAEISVFFFYYKLPPSRM